MGEGKVSSCRGTASLCSPSCTVILYEVEIKVREKLKARRNKECGKKKKLEKEKKLEGRGMWKEERGLIKRIGGGRKESTMFFFK